MARADKALFWRQSSGLAIRSWHYAKRQHCVNFCNFILPPLAVILLAVLNRVLANNSSKAPPIAPYEQRPLGAFAPLPVRPDACARRATTQDWAAASAAAAAAADGANKGGNNNPKAAAAWEAIEAACRADPFVPKFTVPYYVDASAVDPETAAAALGAAVRNNNNNGNAPAAALLRPGVLANLSLDPYVYPEALPGRPFSGTQTPYDGILMNVTGGTPDGPLLKAFMAAQSRPGGLDAAYQTTAVQAAPGGGGRDALLALLVREWYRSTPLVGAYASAYGFDAIVRQRQQPSAQQQGSSSNNNNNNVYAINATVFYNQSSTERANCTLECPVVSGVQRLDAAIFAAQTNGKHSASAYLRRMPRTRSGPATSFVNLILSIFLGLLLHFFIPSFIGFLVYERQSRLRELMTSMGMKSSTYWLATYLSLLAQYMTKIILVIAVGFAVNSTFFKNNSFVFYFILFFLWGNVVIAHAVLFAPFFSDPATAIVFGWLFVIIVNLVGGQYVGQLEYSRDTSTATWLSVMILPSFAFLRSIYLAGAFNSFDKGITLGSSIYKGNELGMCRGSSPVCTSYAYLIVQWIVMMIGGLYLDQVLPSASSVRRHPLFFLGFKRAEHVKDGASAKAKRGKVMADEDVIDVASPIPEDIALEQNHVRALMDGEHSQVRGIVVSNLDKVYPGTNPPVHAVRGLSFAARVNEVTGIIGGNGAGKSTAFRIMTGSIEPTAGNILIDGNSVITDMARVQSTMGVCFQQDIMWDSLTIEEHLCFFARLRGIEKQEIPALVDESLKSVDLTFARKRRAGQCSGGMRRRLSVAISLLGNPSCCLLDEPTTGLDPQTRERVWQAIDAAKQDKTIILTTHSMEEAQKLCDRIGLMSKGTLKCIGQPEELRLRLGRGYNLSVSVPESTAAALHELIMNISSESVVETVLAGNVKYSIPRSVPASKIFNAITANRERLQISDWGLAQSSLEDVFLNVTRDEAAIKERKHAVDDVSIV